MAEGRAGSQCAQHVSEIPFLGTKRTSNEYFEDGELRRDIEAHCPRGLSSLLKSLGEGVSDAMSETPPGYKSRVPSTYPAPI